MEYGNLLNLIPQPMKNIYRKYENLIKKVINAEWSKVFNHTCLKEFLWPTYTKNKYMNQIRVSAKNSIKNVL